MAINRQKARDKRARQDLEAMQEEIVKLRKLKYELRDKINGGMYDDEEGDNAKVEGAEKFGGKEEFEGEGELREYSREVRTLVV
jgi:hypothetical protein